MSEPLFGRMAHIKYQIMTDADGGKWKVPTHIDGEPCEYLRKHDPADDKHTFERITIIKP